MSTPAVTNRSRKHSDEVTNSFEDEASSFLPIEDSGTNALSPAIDGDYSGDKDHKPSSKAHRNALINSVLSPNRIMRFPQTQTRSCSFQKESVSTEPPDATATNQSLAPDPCSTDVDDSTETSNALTIKYISEIGNKFVSVMKPIDGKKVVSAIMLSFISLLIIDTLFSSPENRIFKPDFSEKFLFWVQENPAKGAIWILLLMSVAVIFMVPIGTPITVGCGYIYKGAYGWKIGVGLATVISMTGSALGAVICFLLGRYLMRNQVRKWIKKYPLFDAIDAASAEHGLRIMAMLYLTPILPLGPISYMCGTTSMSLSSFVIAKVAATPLMLLYVFIGASTGALISKDPTKTAEEVRRIEENEVLILSGIGLSFVMIAFITHYIKKELNKILDRQQKHKPGENDSNHNVVDDGSGLIPDDEEDPAVPTSPGAAIELTNSSTIPRQRKH